MNRSSKLITTLTASAIAMTMTTTWAQDNLVVTSSPLPPVAVPISTPISPIAIASTMQMNGIVDQVVTDAQTPWVHIKTSANEDPTDGVILHVSQETWIVDSVSGLPLSLADIKAGDQIIAYHSPVMTSSLPPQTTAKVLLVNPPQDKGAGTYVKVAQLTRREDGSIRVLNDNGDLVLTILPETPISPFKTKNVVTIDDIEVGSEMIAYFDVMALSYPAQAGAERVVLFPKTPSAPSDETATETDIISVSEDLSKLMVNGQDVALGVNERLYATDNGTVMVPVRTAATALGYSVTWSDEDQRIELSKDKQIATLRIGSETVRVGEDEFSLTDEPDLIDGRSYVPVSFFSQLVVPLR